MVYNWLKNNLLPSRCTLCHGPTESQALLCDGCYQDLPFQSAACPNCAASLPADETMSCGSCLRDPPAFDAAQALFDYQWPLDQLISAMKYQHHWHLTRLFGELMGKSRHRFRSGVDLIIPVPLHPHRFRERGFNQSFEIARHLMRYRNIPVVNDLCRRLRDTPAQTGRDASERKRNVRGAFSLAGQVDGMKLAVLDDVMTTGSTAGELAKILKSAGASYVEVWCVARAQAGQAQR